MRHASAPVACTARVARRATLVPSMRMITLDATCHRGHRLKVVYAARALREHLEHGTVRLSCAACQESRPPTPAEALTLTQMVIQSEASEEAGARR